MTFRAFLQAAAQGYDAYQGQQEREVAQQMQKQQLEMGKMKMQEQQQALQDQKELQNALKATFNAEDMAAATPEELSKTFQTAATRALGSGQTDTAKQFLQMSQQQMQIAEQKKQQIQEDRQRANEELAQTAFEVQSAPTPENLQRLQGKLAATGRVAAQVPKAGTPEFAAWLTNLEQSNMTSKERYQAQTQAQRLAQEAKDKEEDLARKERWRTEDRRDAAIERQSNQAFQLKLAQMRAEGKTEPGYAVQQRGAGMVTSAAGETLRSIETAGAFQQGVTGTAFAHINEKSLTEASIKSFTNKMTTPQAQAYNAAISGLGLEVAQAMTGGTGRAPTQALIAEMQNTLGARPGDTPFVVAYKLAQAADMVRVRMESTPAPKDPNVAAAHAKYMKELEAMPKPADLIRLANKNPKLWGENPDKTKDITSKIRELTQRVKTDPNMTQSEDAYVQQKDAIKQRMKEQAEGKSQPMMLRPDVADALKQYK